MKLKITVSYTATNDKLAERQQKLFIKDGHMFYIHHISYDLTKDFIYEICNLDDEKLYNIIKHIVVSNTWFQPNEFQIPITISDEELFYEVLKNNEIKKFLVEDCE